MAFTSDNAISLRRKLEDRFLYQDDLNSIYFLMSLYENECPVAKIKPKYYCTQYIIKRLKRHLNYRRDKYFILSTIWRLINDDINKLELSLFLEAYSIGYQDIKSANKLESFVLKTIHPEHLHGKKKLMHHTKIPAVIQFKEKILTKSYQQLDYQNYIRTLNSTYAGRIIQPKIKQTNKYLNKQLVINTNVGNPLISEEQFLNLDELNAIYQIIVATSFQKLFKRCKDATWYGINDRVLSRY